MQKNQTKWKEWFEYQYLQKENNGKSTIKLLKATLPKTHSKCSVEQWELLFFYKIKFVFWFFFFSYCTKVIRVLSVLKMSEFVLGNKFMLLMSCYKLCWSCCFPKKRIFFSGFGGVWIMYFSFKNMEERLTSA